MYQIGNCHLRRLTSSLRSTYLLTITSYDVQVTTFDQSLKVILLIICLLVSINKTGVSAKYQAEMQPLLIHCEYPDKRNNSLLFTHPLVIDTQQVYDK